MGKGVRSYGSRWGISRCSGVFNQRPRRCSLAAELDERDVGFQRVGDNPKDRTAIVARTIGNKAQVKVFYRFRYYSIGDRQASFDIARPDGFECIEKCDAV